MLRGTGRRTYAGRGTDRNRVEAETWLRRAALVGDPLAAAALGDLYAAERDGQAESARWYRHAAELGHAGSALALARQIAAGAEGRPDRREIVAWLQTAIEHGETRAWPHLIALLQQLEAPEPFIAWLRRQNSAEAAYVMGLCLNCGIGMPASEAKARRRYLLAASMGLMDGMAAAAEMLLNGRGGKADPDLARGLFAYAAKRHHAGARYALSVIEANAAALRQAA